jgi:hypothetical protein
MTLSTITINEQSDLGPPVQHKMNSGKTQKQNDRKAEFTEKRTHLYHQKGRPKVLPEVNTARYLGPSIWREDNSNKI